MTKFIRMEMLSHYLKTGWTVILQGTEMAAVRKKDGTTDDHVRPQE